MPRYRNRSRAVVRTLAWLTLALYGVVMALLALTFAFPRWGKNPHAYYFIYLPPQFTVAVWVWLFSFALAALLGVVFAVMSRSAGRHGWAKGFVFVTALAMQGPAFIRLGVYSEQGVLLPPTAEGVSLVVSVAAFLSIPVLGLVFTRNAGQVGA